MTLFIALIQRSLEETTLTALCVSSHLIALKLTEYFFFYYLCDLKFYVISTFIIPSYFVLLVAKNNDLCDIAVLGKV